MFSCFSKISRVRPSLTASLASCAVVAAACLLAGCSLDGASKKEAAATDQGAQAARAPRTTLPMPPVETAHQTSTRQGMWTMLDGRRGSLSDFRGQAVVLDFWATYCPPCKEEIPHLVALQRRFGTKDLKVIGLNVGGTADQAKVPALVEQWGIQYQLANPDQSTMEMFLVGDGIPQTLVFDRNGRLVDHLRGYDPQIATRLERAIETAVASRPDSTEKASE